MVLMSDTGGGHRASAEALQAGFEQLYGDKYKARIQTKSLQNAFSHKHTTGVGDLKGECGFSRMSKSQ